MSEDRFETLLGLLVDGEPSDEEVAELVALAKDEPVRREEIARQLESGEMIALAEDRLREATFFAAAIEDRLGDDAFVSVVRRAIGRRRRPILPWAIAAAALTTLLVIFLVRSGWPPAGDRPGPEAATIARIADLNGSTSWIGGRGEVDERLEPGDRLTGGTLAVPDLHSLVNIVFNDGSSLWLSGPAELTLSEGPGGKRIRLREGELSLDVSPQPPGRPLRLATPSAEAVVLGTQFNVTADAASTRLTVNEGLVEVKRLADGSIEEVPADHRVVAALEQDTDFVAVPRGTGVHAWRSDLSADVRQGRWHPGTGEGPGFLTAQAHLYRGDHGERLEPILLHSVVVSPTLRNQRPVLLAEGARFRISGRLDRSHRVNFGLGTHRTRGGFAGKYMVDRMISVHPGSDGAFDVELPLAGIPPMASRFPPSAVGHELGWFWIQTVKADAGLVITHVELIQ